MRRFVGFVSLPVLLLTMSYADPVEAQASPDSGRTLALSEIRTAEVGSTNTSWWARAGTAAAAGVVGAWVGFFASQVALGDWDEQDGNGHIDRRRWAAIGGAVGFTLGFSFPIGGRAGAMGASRPTPGAGPGLGLPGGRSAITAAEISGSGASTAYDVVKNLRSEWLLRRLPHAWDTKEEADIRVYLDARLLGGLDALSTVAAQDVQAMYRFDASQATTRWGAGHEEGAILIVTRR